MSALTQRLGRAVFVVCAFAATAMSPPAALAMVPGELIIPSCSVRAVSRLLLMAFTTWWRAGA